MAIFTAATVTAVVTTPVTIQTANGMPRRLAIRPERVKRPNEPVLLADSIPNSMRPLCDPTVTGPESLSTAIAGPLVANESACTPLPEEPLGFATPAGAELAGLDVVGRTVTG